MSVCLSDESSVTLSNKSLDFNHLGRKFTIGGNLPIPIDNYSKSNISARKIGKDEVFEQINSGKFRKIDIVKKLSKKLSLTFP